MSTKDADRTTGAKIASSKRGGKGRKQANDSRLEQFFLDELKDIYWAEKHLIKTLPKMAKAASSEEFKAAFTEHVEVTEEDVTRLEKVFKILGEEYEEVAAILEQTLAEEKEADESLTELAENTTNEQAGGED